MSEVKPTPKLKLTSTSSGVEVNLHSSCYSDFFLLRTPITINGSPAVIKKVDGESVLRAKGISVKLSTISYEAVSPVASKHGVYSVETFYYEQVALFLAKFAYKESLKKFLIQKEDIEKDLSLAVANLFMKEEIVEESKSSKPHQTLESDTSQFQIAVKVKVYLVSPAVGRPVLVNKINLANHSFMFENWKRSKLFDFTNAMFTKPHPSVAVMNVDQAMVPTTSLGSTPQEDTNIFSNSQNDTTIQAPIASNKRGVDSAELADLEVELNGVLAWFKLGVQLKIPTHQLLAIRKDHRYTGDCRLHMLIQWEQLEKPTWTKLFAALVNIGMKGLADSLAKKYCLPQPVSVAVPTTEGRAFSKLMDSEKKLSVKTTELKEAKQLQTVMSQKFEKEISKEVPLLQHKVKTLTDETELLRLQLEHRNQEIKMFEKMKQTAKESELLLWENLLKEKSEQIKSLEEKLALKETELDSTKKQLKDKKVQLARMVKELSTKSDRVCELETEVEKLRRSFDEQQKEMDRKFMEKSAASVSHEMYLKEVEIQRDIAIKEAKKKKEEIQLYTRQLTEKEEEISRLSDKIAIQEREMEKLREELDSNHCRSEQPSVEEMKEDNAKEQQLLTLMMGVMQLQLELRKRKNKKNKDKMNLEGAKQIVETYDKFLELNNQTARSKTQISKQKVPLGETPLSTHLKDIQPQLPQLALSDKQPEVKKKPASNVFTLKWRKGPNAPRSLRKGSSTIIGDTVYVNDQYGQAVYSFNYSTSTWSALPECPYSCSTLTTIDNTLTTVGGEVTNKLFTYRDHQWAELYPPMPTARHSATVLSTTTHVAVMGGYSNYYLNRVDVMDIEARHWNRAAQLPFVSRGASATLCGDTLYYLGDEFNNQLSVLSCHFSELIKSSRYSTQTEPLSSTISTPSKVWHHLPDLLVRHSTCVTVHGKVLAIGGYDKQGKNTTSIHELNTDTNEWCHKGDMNITRSFCLATTLPDNNILVVGGYIHGSVYINRTEIATVTT